MNEAYLIFLEIYQAECNKWIPKRIKNKKSINRWINNNIKSLIKEKHKHWYKRKKGLDKSQYKKICFELKKSIDNAKKQYEKNIAARSKNEPKLIFAYIASKM